MKKTLTMICTHCLILLFNLHAIAGENLTVSKLMASPKNYKEKTVNVSGYMTNLGIHAEKSRFLLFDKKMHSAPAISVETSETSNKDLAGRLKNLGDSIKESYEKGEDGLIIVKGVLKQREDKYYIEIVELPIMYKKEDTNLKKATVSELNRLDEQQKRGKLLTKADRFVKSEFQDKDGKLWFSEDWDNKEVVVTGYIDIHGNLCEGGTKWRPCIYIPAIISDSTRQTLANAFIQQEDSPNGIELWEGEKFAPVRLIMHIKISPNSWAEFNLKEIEFLFLSKKINELEFRPLPQENFIFIRGGCYQMGDTFGDGGSDEKPVHEVCVDNFYMGKYEVTQKEWQKLMGNNPSYYKDCDSCPVEQVSYNDIHEFINTLNQKTGKNYRLPTEAEWEYAARSGGKSEKFAGTSDESQLWFYVSYVLNSGKTKPVGMFKPNGLGLYDMSGNVFEWCSDWNNVDYYKNSPKDNPKGPSSGEYRVVRGGSGLHDLLLARTTSRSIGKPETRSSFVGFRVVLPSR